MGGGTLYEIASRKEAEWIATEEEAYWEPQNAGWQVKSSVEAKRTRYGRYMKSFSCEGTMFRHTKKSWTHAPCALQPPHEVEATKENPVVATVREFLIEDLTPFARDLYWVTAWRKCATCHARDKEFQKWVGRETRAG